ncbi:MAG: hypothetical protein LC624_07990 [Halobacteriales archaeon]|nr:hypothetical protein [Halobacteriales archaeon]
MSFADQLGVGLGFRAALVLGLGLALLGALSVTPLVVRKLRGAHIVGRDKHKPGAPEVPEMGGLAVFLAFNASVFVVLALGGIGPGEQQLVLASLIVAAGACITGVLDDLVELRQRFKAFIPLAFALPLALYAPDSRILFPVVGAVDLGPLYAIVLVPLAVASASNGFNMLEGFNGLGTGLGIILAAAIAGLAILHGHLLGLALLFPLIGALGGFLVFNIAPARVFPGDTGTLLVGATLAAGAVLSAVEFWGFLLFLPHIIEFFLKAKGKFRVQCFASRVEPDGTLVYEGPTRSWTHVFMRRMRVTEPQLVVRMWLAWGLYAGLLVGAFALARSAP